MAYTEFNKQLHLFTYSPFFSCTQRNKTLQQCKQFPLTAILLWKANRR